MFFRHTICRRGSVTFSLYLLQSMGSPFFLKISVIRLSFHSFENCSFLITSFSTLVIRSTPSYSTTIKLPLGISSGPQALPLLLRTRWCFTSLALIFSIMPCGMGSSLKNWCRVSFRSFFNVLSAPPSLVFVSVMMAFFSSSIYRPSSPSFLALSPGLAIRKISSRSLFPSF